MTSRWHLSLAVALAAACGSSTNPPFNPNLVSGTVVEASGGAAIANAKICLLDHPEVACATSDSGGAYNLTLPSFASALQLAVNATAAGHLGFTGLVTEGPGGDAGVTWFTTIFLLDDTAAASLLTSAGFTYPAAGMAFVQLSISNSTGAAVAGDTAAISPVSGSGPVYYNDGGAPAPALTSLSTDGRLLFGDLTPGAIEITVAGSPCTPLAIGTGAWPDAAANTIAGETAAGSMTQMDLICQ